ncbi:MAG: response regulator, partial [Oscillospiraceae bacterium]|nr:response regulator [Oscillospiraceae bacterium]
RLTPDLFLLDYLMPKMTGFDLVPIIRKFPEHDETPIIFLTSEGSTDHVTAAINLGACDFIVKPIKESVLCQKAMMNTIDYMTLRRKRMIFKEAKRF